MNWKRKPHFCGFLCMAGKIALGAAGERICLWNVGWFDRIVGTWHKDREGRGRGKMFCIVGLGNPERKYENTRHNIGFDVIDAIAEKYSIAVRERGFRALFGKGAVEGQRVILLKPQTYMNLSGEGRVPGLQEP